MRATLLLAVLFLASCDREAPSAQTAGLDLQALGNPEVEKYGIYGSGCAFVPSGGGFGSLYLTHGDKAYIKLGDKVVPLAKVDGSAELPAGGWENYSGGGYSAWLSVSGERPKKGDYDAHFAVRDGKNATVYKAEGLARCGG